LGKVRFDDVDAGLDRLERGKGSRSAWIDGGKERKMAHLSRQEAIMFI
jgi:hypothetical protein